MTRSKQRKAPHNGGRSKRKKVEQNSSSERSVVEEELSPGREGNRNRIKNDVKQWIAAVARGDEAEVVKLLVADPTLIDANLAYHPSALYIAAFHGFDTIVALLLQAAKEKPAKDGDSSPSLVDDQTGWAVLHVAAGQGRDKVVELLLLDAKRSCTALHHAAKSGTCRVAELLLAASPGLLDAVDNDGCTALLYAVKRQNEAIVNHLLALNPKNLDAADAGGVSSGMNVLHYAISRGNEALVWRLVEMRPDLIYKPSRSGSTPLSMAMRFSFGMKLFALYSPQAAAALNDLDRARLLREVVQAPEDDIDELVLGLVLPISTLDEVEAAFVGKNKAMCAGRLRALVEDPLAMVLNQDVMGIVNEYLFGEFEVSEFRRMREGQWFEAAAVQDDSKFMAQLLDEDPTLIDAVNCEVGTGFIGSTALHMASYGRCESVVALLVAVKPSLVAVRDYEGNTALHLAAGRGGRIVEILLAASPSSGLIANFEGRTALMEAARNGHLEKVRLLLAGCPDALDLVDQYQCTALLCAVYNHHLETASLLLAAEPRNLRAAESGWNVLHYEVSCGLSFHGHAKNVEKLLAIDPGLVRTLTAELQTPLWLAVDQGCDNAMIENLFHRFPHAVHMADAYGRTPYDIAVQHHNDFVVNLFS